MISSTGFFQTKGVGLQARISCSHSIYFMYISDGPLDSPEHRDALTEEGPIRHMWNQFHQLGPVEHFVIDSSGLDPITTAALVQQRMSSGDLNFSVADL
jgi:hypothetical protein